MPCFPRLRHNPANDPYAEPRYFAPDPETMTRREYNAFTDSDTDELDEWCAELAAYYPEAVTVAHGGVDDTLREDE